MNFRKIIGAAAALAVATVGFTLEAGATVTPYLSLGNSCTPGTNTTNFSALDVIQVSVCLTTTDAVLEQTCGSSFKFIATSAANNNHFRITARTLGPNYNFGNAVLNTLPISVVAVNPGGAQDLGVGTTTGAPNAAAANQLLATFDFQATAGAVNPAYTVTLSPLTIGLDDGALDCSNPQPAPGLVAPTFTFNLTVPSTQPAFTSANPPANATGTVNTVYGGHTFVATGNPAPTFSVTAGAPPAGITLAPGTSGVLSGTPTAGGTFNFTVTASNGVGTAQTQNVQLVIAPTTQTITFNAQVPAVQPFVASGTFAISPVATSTSTGFGGAAIVYSSLTGAVCTVTSTTVTIVTAGTCTIAANQAANASYTIAAQQTQNVTINATAPGPVTGVAAIAGNTQGTVSFTAPANNGGSPITSYLVTCTPAGGTDTSGATALSHVITGLVNGTPYTCDVVANNAIGASSAVTSNSFTPSLAPSTPVFTSANNFGGFTVGVAATTFPVTATGFGPPTITSSSGTFGASGVIFTSGGAGSGTATISGTPTAAGSFSVTLTATNTAPLATPSFVTQLFTITIAKGARTINFAGPTSPAAYSPTPVALTATTTPAGGTVTFSTASAGICSVTGTNVTMLAPGNCVIDANSATDANYLVATTVTQTLVITQATQTITFTPTTPRGFSATPLAISPLATSTSGLAITYTAGGACTVSGATFTTTAIGACTITANQAGNAQYSAATPVPAVINITQGTQSISFGGLPNQSLGVTPVLISATASSGLAVSFSSLSPSICSTGGTNGSTVTILALGNCNIQATQAGSAFFTAALPVTASFQVIPPGAVSLSTSNNPAAFRSPVVLTANITGTNPAGTVTFTITTSAGIVTLCEAVPVASATATCAIPGRLLVTNQITVSASYSGDGVNPPNTTAMTQLVTTNAVTVSAVTIPIQPSVGATVLLKATVTGTSLTNTVSFNENGTALSGCGAVAISLLPGATDIGVASCTVPSITAGLHNYVVTYVKAVGFEQVTVPVTPVVGAADFTDMWWVGQSENGWGVSITQHGRAQFIVLFVYDAFGKPIWYVLPEGTWNAANTAFTGLLYQPTSAPFGSYITGTFQPGSSIGTATVTYANANAATLTYTINGVSGTKAIVRQPFGADDGLARLQVGDMWWGGISQNGWGMNIAQHNRVLFPVWYTYDNMGRTVFYTVPGGTWVGSTFTGDIYTTVSSVWLGANYNPAQFVVTKVGTMTLDFSDQSNAIMTYNVNGLTQQKIIVRQPY